MSDGWEDDGHKGGGQVDPLELDPTIQPTLNPSQSPTVLPTLSPTSDPVASTILAPTLYPTLLPTLLPTISPTIVEDAPLEADGEWNDGELTSFSSFMFNVRDFISPNHAIDQTAGKTMRMEEVDKSTHSNWILPYNPRSIPLSCQLCYRHSIQRFSRHLTPWRARCSRQPCIPPCSQPYFPRSRRQSAHRFHRQLTPWRARYLRPPCIPPCSPAYLPRSSLLLWTMLRSKLMATGTMVSILRFVFLDSCA